MHSTTFGKRRVPFEMSPKVDFIEVSQERGFINVGQDLSNASLPGIYSQVTNIPGRCGEISELKGALVSRRLGKPWCPV